MPSHSTCQNAATPVRRLPGLTLIRVSIIIATYNASNTLPACLASIREQRTPRIEVIVVDGASTDDTAAVVREYDDVVDVWHSEPDKGLYDAWNKGVQRARGDYIAFLGADDALRPRAAERMIELAQLGADLVSFRGEVVGPDGHVLGVIGRRWSYRGIARRMGICHPGALHARHLFDRVGLFDPRYRIAADYDWMLRLPASTSAAYVEDVLVRIADGGVSRTRRLATMKEYWRIQSRCPRLGPMWASWVFLDRLWRPYVARAFGLHY